MYRIVKILLNRFINEINFFIFVVAVGKIAPAGFPIITWY